VNVGSISGISCEIVEMIGRWRLGFVVCRRRGGIEAVPFKFLAQIREGGCIWS